MGKKIAIAELNEPKADVPVSPKAKKSKDMLLAFFLTYLYFLLGIPLGMIVVMPLIFSARNIPLTQQGIFSINRWAPTLKIFIAPIIDSVYVAKFGRRKSWIVGTQFFLGLFMVLLADFIQTRLDLAANRLDMIIFTAFFFTVSFTLQCCGIASDGLALTTLSKENKTWLATCRAVGTNLGIVVGQNLLNLLESPAFCNNIRNILGLPEQTYGLVSLKIFLYIYGGMFILTSLVVAIFKYENKQLAHKRMSTLETYKTIWRIVKIKPIQLLMFFLISFKMGYAEKGIPILKIIRNGFSKDFVSLFMYTPLTPVNILWPLLISRFTSGMKPLKVFFTAYPIRIALSLYFCGLVYYSSYYKPADGIFSNWFTFALFIALAIELVTQLTFDLSRNAFIASICDEKIGGTYIAVLHTVTAIGQNFPNTLSFFLIDSLTTMQCVSNFNFFSTTTAAGPTSVTVEPESSNATTSWYTYSNSSDHLANYTCYKPEKIKECKENGGVCEPIFDAFYLWVAVFAIIGVVFMIFMKKPMNDLCKVPKSEFYLPEKKTKKTKEQQAADAAKAATEAAAAEIEAEAEPEPIYHIGNDYYPPANAPPMPEFSVGYNVDQTELRVTRL